MRRKGIRVPPSHAKGVPDDTGQPTVPHQRATAMGRKSLLSLARDASSLSFGSSPLKPSVGSLSYHLGMPVTSSRCL
jgi:hypothetical protein